ncbi:hypothetical protein [Streptomyces sp. NPDC126503]|uniref:hypothetical protein n=1 Tax=Streptomyces sp. NPDC126503 TaxID=3155315 RepID=UPI0033223436
MRIASCAAKSYTDLHRDARRFATALSRHLYVMRDREIDDDDVRTLEETKGAQRNRWSEAIMIAPGVVLEAAQEVNDALIRVCRQVKRQEKGNPRPGETLQTAAEAQQALWPLIHTMGDVMRRDLGVAGEISVSSWAGPSQMGVSADMPSTAQTGVARRTQA